MLLEIAIAEGSTANRNNKEDNGYPCLAPLPKLIDLET